MNQTHTLQPGTLLKDGSFRIEKILGEGGFGITYLGTFIYKAKYSNIEQKVAIKELFLEGKCVRADKTVTLQTLADATYKDFKNRFIKESEQLAKFDHKGIVKVIDVFEENNTAYFVMDFVEGQNLKDYIKSKGGKINEQEAKQIITEVLVAISLVHSKSILHRDIKPENILISKEGKVVLIDFGAARQFMDDKSIIHTKIYTPSYGAPEQMGSRIKPGAYTDIYAIGATLYCCLTGESPLPFTDRIEPGSIEDFLAPPIQKNPQISESINNVVIKAMQLKHENRFQTAAEMLNALKNGHTAGSNGNEKTILMEIPDEDVGETELLEDSTGVVAEETEVLGDEMYYVHDVESTSETKILDDKKVAYKNKIDQGRPEFKKKVYQPEAPLQTKKNKEHPKSKSNSIERTNKKKLIGWLVGIVSILIISIVVFNSIQNKKEEQRLKEEQYLAYIEQGENYMEGENYEAAIERFEAALFVFPEKEKPGNYIEEANQLKKEKDDAEKVRLAEEEKERKKWLERKGTFTDERDGQTYKWLRLGNQIWMAENLKATKYSNGKPILNITDKNKWGNNKDKAWCWYGNSSIYGEKYGVLYNWNAAMNGAASSKSNPSGVQGVCPCGWHLPSDKEWTQLEEYLIANGYNFDGSFRGNKIGKALSVKEGWEKNYIEGNIGNNQQRNNKSGFTALPGSYRDYDGNFQSLGSNTYFWTTSEFYPYTAYFRALCNHLNGLTKGNYAAKRDAYYVRCIKD